MAVHFAKNADLKPQQQSTQYTVQPAPMRGIDTRVNVASSSADVALLCQNMVPNDYGLKVRRGYREWQVGLGAEVRTIIPYTGIQFGAVDDKCFAVTENGIYDVTTYAAAPVEKIAFTIQDDDAGYGVYAAYTNGAGDSILYYADGSNGLFAYDAVTDTWALATGITTAPGTVGGDLDLTKVVFVVAHKLRLWLVEKETQKGWYLPILSTTGEAAPFFFGSKFKHGGALVGLYNWTLDSGSGVDDHLVAVSRAGDVIPYRGDDPTATGSEGLQAWQNIGTWFIGDIPRGNRICSEYGGNLMLLSAFGLTSMQDLLSGTATEDPQTGIGARVAVQLRRDIARLGNDHGWNIKFITHQGQLMVSVPQLSNQRYSQYVYNIATQGWGVWDGVPLLTSDPWIGALMVGTKDGRVLRMDVNVDNVRLNQSSGNDINWYVLTGYSSYGSPGSFKRGMYVRPNFAAGIAPVYKTFFYYDYTTSTPIAELPVTTGGSGSQWDDGLWGEWEDAAVWSADGLNGAWELQGGSGMGRTIALATVGTSRDETYLVSWDVAWNQGGFL